MEYKNGLVNDVNLPDEIKSRADMGKMLLQGMNNVLKAMKNDLPMAEEDYFKYMSLFADLTKAYIMTTTVIQ